MDDDAVVEVYNAANAVEAYALKNVLEESGIRTRVVGDMLQTAAGELPVGFRASPRIWVTKGDEARAKEILAACEAHHRGDVAENTVATWKCPNCGEEVETDFELCWNCQRPRAKRLTFFDFFLISKSAGTASNRCCPYERAMSWERTTLRT